LKAKFIPSNTFDLVKHEWEKLSLKKGELVTEFNQNFHRLHSKLDLHQPMPAQVLADAYGYKIEKGNQGVYKDLVHYIGMRDRSPTLGQYMKHLAALDSSLNHSRPGCGPSTTITTKASARKMDSMKGDTTGTASVSNCSNPLERVWVRVRTGTEPWQQVLPHKNPDCCHWACFTTKNPSFHAHNFGSN